MITVASLACSSTAAALRSLLAMTLVVGRLWIFESPRAWGRGTLFPLSVGTHHEGLTPERDREFSIGPQQCALNVGSMTRLLSKWLSRMLPAFGLLAKCRELYGVV